MHIVLVWLHRLASVVQIVWLVTLDNAKEGEIDV